MKNKISSIIQKIMDSGTSKSKLILAAIELVAMAIIMFGVIPNCQLLAVLGYIFLIAVLIYTWKKEDYEEIKIIAITIMYFYFVYSTYYGRENWLGSNFYKAVMYTEIPLGWVFLMISILFIITIYDIVRRYISVKNFLGILLFSLIFNLIVWYPLSFVSYYSGYESRVGAVSSLLYNVTDKILQSQLSPLEKDNMLRDIYANVSMRAKLYKNGQEYLITDTERFIIENPKASNLAFKKGKPIEVGDDKYQYSASKVYRPDDLTGVTRAITWSVFPDRFGDDAKLEAHGITASSNDVYLGRRKAGRSMNWWMIYSATFGLFCAAICYWKKRDIKITAKLEAAEKKYRNTSLYQELLFSQLAREFNDIMASRAKSHLQEFVAALDKNEEQKVYSEKGLDKTMEDIKESIGDRVHTLKNKWNKYVDDDKDNIAEIVHVILDDLRDLKQVFDISYPKQKLFDVDRTIMNAVPEEYKKTTSLQFAATYLDAATIDNNLFVRANLYRLKSIVNNLLGNSSGAIQRFYFKLPREERKTFFGKILLSTNVEEYDGKKYYTIIVQDNGGGFPNPAIIYKEPVVSSDTSAGERKGSGTVYIDAFVKMMDGFIEASNEKFEDSYMGAKTKIYIPLVSKEEADEEL